MRNNFALDILEYFNILVIGILCVRFIGSLLLGLVLSMYISHDSNAIAVAYNKFVMQMIVKLNVTAIDDKSNVGKFAT